MEKFYIPMEAEAKPLLIGGFSGIIILTLICIIFLWWRNKRFSYAWFIGQVVLLVFGFKSVLRIFDLTVSRAMLSEEISLIVGSSALLWAVSMVCMLIGIWQLNSNEKNRKE